MLRVQRVACNFPGRLFQFPLETGSQAGSERLRLFATAALLAQHEQVQAFRFFARPGCLAQKFQAGRHAGVALKAAHRNALAQSLPAVVRRQRRHHGFQRHAMQRVAWLGRSGWSNSSRSDRFCSRFKFRLPGRRGWRCRGAGRLRAGSGGGVGTGTGNGSGIGGGRRAVHGGQAYRCATRRIAKTQTVRAQKSGLKAARWCLSTGPPGLSPLRPSATAGSWAGRPWPPVRSTSPESRCALRCRPGFSAAGRARHSRAQSRNARCLP